MKKLSQSEAIRDLMNTHGGKYGYEKAIYAGSDGKITITCPTHGDFEQSFKLHKSGSICPSCQRARQAARQLLDTAEFVKRAKAVHGGAYDYTNTEYKGSKSKVWIGCKACGASFEQEAATHYNGGGCPRCSFAKGALVRASKPKPTMPVRISEDQFFDSVVLPTNIRRQLGSYQGVHKPMIFICDQHGAFTARAYLAKTGKFLCAACKSEAMSLRQSQSLEQVLTKAASVHNGYYTYEGDQHYKGNRSLLNIICPRHGPFRQMAMSHLAGRGCRACGYEANASRAPYMISSGEVELLDFCRTLAPAEQSNRSVLYGSELDIYLPEKQLAVEFNGLYWHSSENHGRMYHLRKTLGAAKKGVDLIHIFEDEWSNKPEIVKSIIRLRLGIPAAKYFARKLSRKPVPVDVARAFYNANHIQGFVGANVHLGLYDGVGNLRVMASFSPPRKVIGTKEGDWELVRFCSLLNTQVVGGLSKLLAGIEGDVVSFCDRRLFNGSGYIAAGFELLRYTDPGFYYVKGKQRFSRFKFQKHKLPELLDKFDPNISEQANMLANGYRRLYDCGNAVLILRR